MDDPGHKIIMFQIVADVAASIKRLETETHTQTQTPTRMILVIYKKQKYYNQPDPKSPTLDRLGPYQ